MRMHFAKIYALGEDYLVVDAVTQKVYMNSSFISKMSDRIKGIGFSRLVTIEPPYDPDLDFHIRVFDKTGKEIKYCFDGACMATCYAFHKNLALSSRLGISSLSGRIFTQLPKESLVIFQIGSPEFKPNAIPFRAQSSEKTYILQADGQNVFCSVLKLGVAYCVVETSSLDIGSKDKFLRLAHALSGHERFPEGSSVCFYEKKSRNEINLGFVHRTGIVQGCIAAVVSGINQGLLDRDVVVHFDSDVLDVKWEEDSGTVICSSPVSFVFDGDIEI